MINYNLNQTNALSVNLEIATQQFITQTWVKLDIWENEDFDFYVSWLTTYKLWDLVKHDLDNHLNPANYNYFTNKAIKFLNTDDGLITVKPYIDYGIVIYAVPKHNLNTKQLTNLDTIKQNTKQLSAKDNFSYIKNCVTNLNSNLEKVINHSTYPLASTLNLEADLTKLKQASLVGYMCFTDNFDFVDLDNIAVNKAFRSLGFGKFMLNVLIAFAKMHEKCERISLEVRVSNTNAINLYQNLGFKIVHTRKNYYTQSALGDNIAEDAFVMVKELEQTANNL